MTHIAQPASVAKRRMALALIVSALLAIITYMAMSPGSVSATTGSCDAGDFCMWNHSSYTGGL